MDAPSRATVKRLFAISGNRCAFPKCPTPLVEPVSGKVTGRISHIKASQPGGSRYDADQADEIRHGFANLVLLCPIHHDVVDADPDAYSVERLLRMKASHEAAQPVQPEPSDSVARQLITNVTGNTISHGSIIVSQNQLGGQIAHSIQNFGPQPRAVSVAAGSALVAALGAAPLEHVDLSCVMGDTEGYQLADTLKGLLATAGWTVNGVNQSIFSGPITGIQVITPKVRPSLERLAAWMQSAGLKVQGIHDPTAITVRIIIGANL